MTSEAGVIAVTAHGQADDPMVGRREYYILLMLGLAYGFNTLDRVVMSVLIEPLKAEFAISDTQIGLLTGFAFALFNGLAVIPLGILADRVSRKNVLSACFATWSAMTAMGGLAQSFVQLMLLRITVGASEAGCSSPSLSMIADSFPPARRATATSVFYIFAPIGGMVALAVGGWLVGHYGWRITLLAAGLPGMLVAALVFFTVTEPKRGRYDAPRPKMQKRASFRDALRSITQCPALLHLVIGITLIAFFVSAITTWKIPFFLRSYGLSIQQVGPVLAILELAAIIGPLLGGALSDSLALRDKRWWCWFVAISLAVGATANLVLTGTNGLFSAIASLAIYTLALSLWFGPSYSLVQSLAPSHVRTTILATLALLTNVVGFGLGTQVMGILSDLLAPTFGHESLRYALMTLTVVGFWGAFHFILASRTLVADLAHREAAAA